ncbi:tatD DNase domain containing 3-like isoform X3 [Syngnathus acus]|uniref:tatD DNase domain containing 3-like isoform X3 n=1 Tax=Syngnathus acus TaxID=161584 RepID=UPI0018862DB5|nr:tatD DNase domain containing 3-like isoform X3 [Syngnathus acus]
MHGFLDCHCHISAADFDKDIETVIEHSKQAGLLALLAVAEHAGEFDKIIALSKRFPGFVLPCLGVHPVQEVSSDQHRSASLQDLDAALPLIDKYKDQLVAIGEVGLDFTPRYVKSESDKESQREVLIRQARLAKELDLPLNVHSRSAGRPTIQLLKEQGVEKVLLHAFDGKPSVAMEGVKAGYFFSIPPSIVRSEQVRVLTIHSFRESFPSISEAETCETVASREYVPGNGLARTRPREAGEKRAQEHHCCGRVYQRR